MVQAAWGRGHSDVPKSLDVVQFDAKIFNLETFGNISHRKRVLEVGVETGQARLGFTLNRSGLYLHFLA